jgi:hypothetical protein
MERDVVVTCEEIGPLLEPRKDLTGFSCGRVDGRREKARADGGTNDSAATNSRYAPKRGKAGVITIATISRSTKLHLRDVS